MSDSMTVPEQASVGMFHRESTSTTTTTVSLSRKVSYLRQAAGRPANEGKRALCTADRARSKV